MKENNIILEKSCNFALRTIKLYMHLRKIKNIDLLRPNSEFIILLVLDL